MQHPVVKVQQGSLQGRSDRAVNRFLGIPYAAPPVGSLRWQAPQPVAVWSEMRDAGAFGAICVQPPPPAMPASSSASVAMSEDCLTLNVWRPSGSPRNLPVLVWFHGGAFRMGGTALPMYNGASLASQGAVVVTVNYRLGALGVFAHPALQQPTGNFGLLDLIAALRWVQDNIAGFGGDHANVTIFGESAGGASVAYLLSSSLARGLFAKAIMQSGALDLAEFSTHAAQQAALQAVEAITQPHSTAEELRALTAQDVLHLDLAPNATMPYVDGVLICSGMVAAFEQGHFVQVPLLIGSNDFEAGFFGKRWYESVPQRLSNTWAEARLLTDGYGTGTDELRAAQVATDRFATVDTRKIASAVARHTQPVYRYYFSYVAPSQRATISGAIHTADVGYVFGTLDGETSSDRDSNRKTQRDIQARWLAFARSGSPNQQSLLPWPAYDPSLPSILEIGKEGDRLIDEPHLPLLELLERTPSFHMN